MSSPAVARRYAAALADVTLAQGETQEVLNELIEWEKMIDSSALLQELLNNPTIALEQKQKALKELIVRTQLRPTTANFLRVLLKNHRLGNLSEINSRLAQVLDERAGVVSAEVISARPLEESSRHILQENLKRLTGREVRMKYLTDETLLGGMVTKIGSTVYDGSIRNQLEELGKRLAGN